MSRNTKWFSFSLRFIKSFKSKPIWMVTDTTSFFVHEKDQKPRNHLILENNALSLIHEKILFDEVRKCSQLLSFGIFAWYNMFTYRDIFFLSLFGILKGYWPILKKIPNYLNAEVTQFLGLKKLTTYISVNPGQDCKKIWLQIHSLLLHLHSHGPIFTHMTSCMPEAQWG